MIEIGSFVKRHNDLSSAEIGYVVRVINLWNGEKIALVEYRATDRKERINIRELRQLTSFERHDLIHGGVDESEADSNRQEDKAN